MTPRTLGQEIRRLRNESGKTLRGLARQVEVSAAHLSDIERDRRRPSEALLRRIARGLRGVGATFEGLERHVTGLDAATRRWVASTPGSRALLRKVLQLSKDPRKLLPAVERVARRKTIKKKSRRKRS